MKNKSKSINPRYFYCRDCGHPWRETDPEALIQNTVCPSCLSKQVRMVRLVEQK